MESIRESNGPQPARDRAKKSKRARGFLLGSLKTTVTLGTFGLIFSALDLNAFVGAFSEVSWLWIGLLVLPYALGILLQTLRWKLLLRDLGVVAPLWVMFRRNWGARFFRYALPGQFGGDAFRIIAGVGVPADRATLSTSVLLDRLTGLVGLFGLLCVAGLLGAVPSGQLALRSISWAAFIGVLLSLPWLLTPAPGRWVQHLSKGLPQSKVTRFLHDVVEGVVNQSRKRKSLVAALAFSVLFHASVAVLAYFGFQALEVDVAFLSVLFVIPILNFAASIPISFNGLGVVEGGFAVMFTALGVDSAQAVAVAVLLRVTVTCMSLFGGLLYLFDKRTTARAVGDSALERVELKPPSSLAEES